MSRPGPSYRAEEEWNALPYLESTIGSDPPRATSPLLGRVVLTVFSGADGYGLSIRDGVYQLRSPNYGHGGRCFDAVWEN